MYTDVTMSRWKQTFHVHSMNCTTTYAVCKLSDSCHMRIPFTGSGITIYTIQGDGNVNVNVTLDGNTSSTTTNTHAAGSAMKTYNFSLYNAQSLSFGYHEVDILLLDWTSGAKSTLWFDYAAINNTKRSSVNPLPTQSSASSISTRSHMNLIVIMESVAGGLLLVAAMVMTLLCARRRQHKSERIELDPIIVPVIHDSSSETGQSIRSYPSLSHHVHSIQSTRVIPDPSALPSTSTLSLHPAPWHLTPPSPDDSTTVTTKLSVTNPSNSNSSEGADTQPTRILVPSQPTPSAAPESSSTSLIHPEHEPMRSTTNAQLENAPNAQLNDDMTDSWDTYTPATDLGRAIARMRAGRAALSQGSWSDEMKGEACLGTAPPSYDVLYGRWA